MKRLKAFFLFQLLLELVITLFLAGIVVPSLLRSDLATRRALAAGSLHVISVARMAFSYTNQNLAFAILGALAGTIAAFGIHFHFAAPTNSSSARISTLRAALLRN
jgi:hypothetical protein